SIFTSHVARRYLHSFPTRRSSDLSADISDTTRSGPHCMLTCAMTPSTTTSVTRPAKRLRPELTTPLGSGRDPADDWASAASSRRSEEHTSELQSRFDLVCRRLLEK